MNARERVRFALEGGEPRPVPCALAFYDVNVRSLAPRGAFRDDSLDIEFVEYPAPPEEEALFERFYADPPDTRLGSRGQMATYAEWDYRPASKESRNPLAAARSLDDLERFALPTARGEPPVEELTRRVRDLHARGLAAGGNPPHLGGELFETAWRLRGLENFLIDLARRPEWADLLLDRLTVVAKRHAAALARAGADVLAIDDDVGMPGGLMISPAMWRRFFKGRLAEILGAARGESRGVRFLYHSDGAFDAILDDLVEIGFHAINPLQPEHMDAAAVRRRFGPSLALWGTVGRQTTFSFASPDEIREEVRLRVETLGRAGLVLSPAYDIDEPDIPWANIAAFLAAAREFG
ncbi:MAG: uroporphyrinogen decarboxylase family protein [Candidatus Eisenbacteria bacterium]